MSLGSKRLESLDVLRGFDMFFILLPDPVPCIVVTFLAMFGLEHSAFAQQFDHCAWNGLRFYDCIFPLFLFISGVTFPYSLASHRARGGTTSMIVRKILRRMVILFLMGAMLWTVIDGTLEKNFLAFDWEHFRVWSVIGRIGIAWGVAAFFYVFLGRKARVGVAVAILVGMWFVMRFVTAPGAPEGVNPMEFEMRNWLFCRWVDVNFLTTAHRAEGGFTTITMIPTALFGMFAGEILTGQASQRRKAANLVLFALGLLVAGLLMAFAFGSYSLPINKSVWTSSFALVVGGISAGLLALFYWMVDIRGWRRWGFFFKVIGMNAITVYLLMRTVFNTPFALDYFFSGLYKVMPPLVADFFAQAGLIAIVWTLLLFLYRRKIFLRV